MQTGFSSGEVLQVLLLWDTAASTLEVKLLPSAAVEYASVRCCCALQ